ncbi:MAG: tetratricopeptide repeat protein [Patescibacteria group bacterium]
MPESINLAFSSTTPVSSVGWGELLKLLVNSTPFWIAVVSMVALLIFRRPISGFIERLTRAKVGKDMLDLSSHSPGEDKPITENKEAEVPEKTYQEEKREDEKVEEQPTTYEGWRTEMIIASWTNNPELFERAYVELLKLCPSELIKKRSEVLYLRTKNTAGDTSSLSKLKEKLGDPDIAYDVHMALGFCYASSNDYKNANHYYEKAIALAKTEEEKTGLARNFSSSLYKDGQKEEAIDFLGKTLIEVSSDELRADLYEELADIYEKEKDYDNRAFVLDKALEFKPNNPGLLFGAGYAYSQSNYDELSLLHYLNATHVDPKNDSVKNNLGVQYENLKMPSKSIQSYQDAEKEGNTLASANLAYRLMGAGFVKEATQKLDTAKGQTDPHPNVGAAISDAAKIEEEEGALEKEATKRALVQRKFFTAYAEAKHVPGHTLALISGDWRSDNGTIFSIRVNGEKIVGTWTEPGFGENISEFKFKGAIKNNSSTVSIFRKEYNFSTSKKEYKLRDKESYLFLKADGQEVHFLRIEQHGGKTLLLLKKQPIL